MFCFAAHGTQSVSLAWNASTDPATAGYILHYGSQSHSYTAQINVGTNTMVTLSGLTDGQTYYFVVGCFDIFGLEGTPSNEALFVAPTNVPPVQPSGSSFAMTPASGPPGTEVDVYPANPGSVSGVSLSGVNASFTVVSNAYLAVTVPAGATTGPLRLTTASGTLSGRFTVASTTGPANDNFASAQVLNGANASAWASTTGATKEPGEPNHGGNSGGASVWYRWTAPTTGAYTLDTSGTQFVPLLAVYTGNNVSQLSVVASNAAPASGPLSFQASKGVTYQIAVDGYGGKSGNMLLRLSPSGAAGITDIFSETFDSEGLVTGALAGQNGWVGSVPALSGVTANYFPGYGLQGYIGLSALALTSNTVLLSHPLSSAIDTNNQPVVQFSVLVQIYNPLNIFHDSFGWAFRNTAGQQLFSIMFNNGTGQITYGLDDGAGQRSTGAPFTTAFTSQLEITADFSRNEWSATLNKVVVVAGQPISTARPALPLGYIDAEAIYQGLQSQIDAMVFDNITLTASPEPFPEIVLGLQPQTITSGSTTALNVIASGTPPLCYQWFYDGQPIPGATNAGLWLTNATPAASGNYQVAVANENDMISAGCQVAVSNPPVMALIANAASPMANARAVNFNVVSGRSYRVQASTNMTVWSQVSSFYAKGTNAAYFDATAAASSRRFYRLASP
jgi:hypothetical protein